MTARGVRWIEGLSALALGLFLVWSIVGEAVRSGGLGDRALDDYALARDLGTRVVDAADYAWQLAGEGPVVLFAYPPPDALLHAALGAAGPVAGPVLFMLAVAMACWVAGNGCLRLMGAERRPFRWAALLLGVGACRAFVQADLHLLNSNALAVGLALGAAHALGPVRQAGGRDLAGGLLLAASIAVKPFALGIVVVLAALGRRAAVGWTLAGLVLGFGVIPVMVLGPAASIDLTWSWLVVLRQTGALDAVDRISVDNVSIAATLGSLGVGPGATLVVVRGLQLAWLALIAGLIGRALVGQGGSRPLDGRSWLLLAATAIAAPIPLSTIVQPHHLVAAAPLAIVSAFDALDPATPAPWRRARLVLLLAVFVLSSYAPAGAARGLAFAACPVLVLIAAWLPALEPCSPLPATAERRQFASTVHEKAGSP